MWKFVHHIEPILILIFIELPANMPKTVVTKDGSQKKLFFSKRNFLKFEDSPRNVQVLSGKIRDSANLGFFE